MNDEEPRTAEPIAKEVVDVLVAHHREFLRYVEKRTGDRALAEEIVQDAFARSLDRADAIEESAIGWFYRVLRNAIVDRHRRRTVTDRRLEALAAEMEATAAPEEELARIACRCVVELASTLKPEYADALRRIEIDGMPVKEYADASGISASNAGVRIFRARDALRKQVARACGTCAEHGCLDCTCDAKHA